jgi:probable F420-dependent oxidoreductase
MTLLDPDVAFTLPLDALPPAQQLDYARHAESLGYAACWLLEGANFDSFSLAGALARTISLPIGTAVVPIYNRTPMLLAMSAAALSHMTDGRFILGLGSSSEPIISGWNGLPLERPLQRMRETVEIVRRLLCGERVTFEGETLRIRGAALLAPPNRRVPIYLGALNRRMLRLAGEVADGLVINLLAPEQVPLLLDPLYDGAAAAGRDPEQIDVVLRLPLLVDAGLDERRAQARAHFGPYVAATGYNRFFRSIGFEREANAVREAYERRDRRAVEAAITDELADALITGGAIEACRSRIRDYGRYGVKTVVIYPLVENADDCLSALEQLAPSRACSDVSDQGSRACVGL